MTVPNCYAEVTVIVDGAQEHLETFYDEAVMQHFIGGIEEEAKGDGYPTEVYVMYHDHAPGECECAQYVTDHHPQYSWNMGEDE